MKTLRRLMTLALVPVLFAGCSGDPAGPTPQAAPNASLLGDLFGLPTSLVHGLLSCNVSTTSTAPEQTVGPAGGIVHVGPHSLYIPPGALLRNETISATAPAGDIVAVEFQPQGLRFARGTTLRMSYRDCGLVNGVFLRIAYVGDDRTILEVLPLLGNDLFRREVSGRLTHFSSYVIAE